MFKSLVPLSNIGGWNVSGSGATAGHTVSCQIQPGPRFHKILITGGAGTSAGATVNMTSLIGDIRLIVDDGVVRLHSAAELNALNVLYGPQYAAVNGNHAHATAPRLFQLPVYFSEPWRLNDLVGEKLAWNTKFVRTFKIEVDIKPGTFVAAIPLSFMAEVDDAELDAGAPGTMGLIKHVGRTSENLGQGWNDYMKLPRSGVYQEINIVTPTNVTQVEVKRGKEVIIGPITLAQLRASSVQAGMEPLYRAATSPDADTRGGTAHAAARGMTDIVFDLNDRLDSGFIPDPSKDFNLRLNCAAGENTNIIYQRLAPL